MKINFKICQRSIAYILFTSLFIHSCSVFHKSTLSTQKCCSEIFIKKFNNKRVVVQEGYVVHFYMKAGKLKATVEEDLPGGLKKEYSGLPVYIEKNLDMQKLMGTNKLALSKFIHVNLPEKQCLGYVFVGLQRSIKIDTYNQDEQDRLVVRKGKDELPQIANETCTYTQACQLLKVNSPQAASINLSHEKLNKNQFEVLKQIIDNNVVVGYIHWGEVPPDCCLLKEQIEKRLVQNICNYTYHPSDYIHGLLAYHIYTNPKAGQRIDLSVLSQEISHQLSTSIHTSWEIVQVKDDSRKTGYYSALYVNKNMHQAVLAFQGTKFELAKDLLRTYSDLQEDIDGVLGNAITEQQALAYEATKNAVDYIKHQGFNLSITGHSLGGYFAELGVAFCYLEFNCRKVKGVVFDSPGTDRKLNSFKSNIKNHHTKFIIEDLPIITYLSAPNLINACNGHPGEVYRIYPNLKWPDWVERCMKLTTCLPNVGLKLKNMSKSILAITGHSLVTMLSLFNPVTGKPREYIRVEDWPTLNTDNLPYVGKKDILGTNLGARKGAIIGSSMAAGTGPIGYAIGYTLGHCIGNHVGGAIAKRLGTVASVATVLANWFKIDQQQYLSTLAYLDEACRQPNLVAKDNFKLNYLGHYKQSSLSIREHALNIDDYKGIDWYLFELYKHTAKLERLSAKDLVLTVLKNIVKDYEVISVSGRPFIRLTTINNHIECLRDKMRRALDVLPVLSIEDALEASTIHDLTKKFEDRYIQHFRRLRSYITQAKSKNYMPRENKQEELRTQLAYQGICVVYGHGGVGKSTLVAEYGYEQKERQAVWWIPAETLEKLTASYQHLAQELDINYQKLAQEKRWQPNQYLPELVREIYNVLDDRKQSTLLILDNATDTKLINECLLHRPSLVQIIITTRDQRSFSDYIQIKLDAFTYEEGQAYIQKKLNFYYPDKQAVQDLIEEVGLIPQKLELATSYIKEVKFMSIEKYVTKLRDLKQQGKKQQGKLILPEARLGLETLNTSAQLLMRYGVYLDPDFIPLSLVNGLLRISDEEELDAILVALERLSLITIISRPSKEGIQIHREVQAACKEYQVWKERSKPSQQELVSALIQVLEECMPDLSEVSDSMWNKANLYATNVTYFLSEIQEGDYPFRKADELFQRLGDYNQKIQYNYHKALEYYKKSLKIRKEFCTNNYLDIAISYNRIGSNYQAISQFHKATNSFHKAIKMLEINHSVNTNEKAYADEEAWALNGIATIYATSGNYQEALRYYDQTWKIYQKIYKDDHYNKAYVLVKKGIVYQALGNYQAALAKYQEALKIYKNLYVIDSHVNIAHVLNRIGSAYERLNRHQEALEKYYKPALIMYQKVYEDNGNISNHPDIAYTLNGIGSAYQALGKHQKALYYHEEAHKVYKEVYKNNNAYIAYTLNGKGAAYQGLARYQESLTCHQEAHNIYRELYKNDHPDIAYSLNKLGATYLALGKHQQALEKYERALNMYRIRYKGNHIGIASTLNGIGAVYQALCMHQEALDKCQQALKMYKEIYTTETANHSDTAYSLYIIGSIYQDLFQYQEALKYLSQAFEIYQQIYPEGYPYIQMVKEKLVAVQQKLN